MMRQRGLATIQAGLEQRIRLEWYTVTCLLSALTFALSYFGSAIGLDRLDFTFYDRVMQTATHVPPSDDIVIVTIDDDSISQLGYWPWRRSTHAQLLDRLSQARVVGMDLVLADLNPAYAEDDALLAWSMRTHGRVVLPLIVHADGVMKPLATFSEAAAAMGSINARLDSDGVVRSVQAAYALDDDQTVEHFVVAMLETGGQQAAADAVRENAAEGLGILYAGPPGSFTHYPYAKVLSGEVPASAFAGKYVLVGAWASALGDFFNVPVSSSGQLMAGVEILANALQNALHDTWITKPSRFWMAVLATLPTLLVCLMLRRWSPRRAFYMSVAVLAAIFVMDWLMLRYAHVWLAPTASLVGVVFAYPVWSWRSQEAALKHIDGELEKLHGEKLLHGQRLPDDKLWRHDASLPARITKLHKAITTLRQAIAQREQALRFLSHDMRSPQNAILALTQLQRHSDQPLAEAPLLDQIDNYAQKTLALVDGFVQLARAESMALAFREVDLVDLLSSACDERWPQAQRRRMAINFETTTPLAYVQADAGVLARMFGNLLDNALKYSGDGTKVSCRLSREAGNWRVDVQDSGRGISEEQQRTLFEPFTRFGDDQPDNPPGSGLGLSFVQAIVKRHHGSIEVESELGSGSVFSVRLPVAEDDSKSPVNV